MFYKSKTLLFIIIFIMTYLVVGIQAFLLFQSTQDTIVLQIGNNAKNTAASVATFLERDIENYKTLLGDEESYNKEYYKEMLLIFQKLKAKTGADFIYTAKYVSEKEIEYILDGEEPTDKQFSFIGTKDSIEQVQLDALKNGIITASGIVYQENWGHYLSGYAPIKDYDGTVISVVAVDISLKSIDEIITRIIIAVVIGSGILSFLLSFVVYKLVDQRQVTKSFDYLTGLYSRSYFDTNLSRLIKQRRNEYKKLSLLMIDVDHFKMINDQYGHHCGDTALKSVAEVLKQCTRSEDTCARFAGDEFVIALPESSELESVRVCERILDRIREIQIISDNNEIIKLTVSIGMAEWRKGMTPIDIMEAADNMLYVSKKEGKDRYTVQK